jgi:UDP-glucose 4-epimerase
MSKVPVLVTGGAGYIGSHAVLALRDAGWDVAVIDNLSTGTRYLVPDEVTFYEGNVADRELVDRIFAERDIGAILHFAGSIVVPESVEKPLEYYRNNTIASHALVSAAVDAGVKHIVFSSTAAVYGEPERVPVDETVAKLPINPYGASKLMTERMLEDSAAAYPMNYAALRYFNVSGADPEGRAFADADATGQAHARADVGGLADFALVIDDRGRVEDDAVGDADLRADDRARGDDDVAAQRRGRRNHGRRVDGVD